MKRIGKKKAPASPPKRGQNAMAPGRAITGRKRTEEALRDSEAQNRRLFENSLLAISQTSLDGKLVRVNRAYARMYGYASPKQMIAEVTDIEHQLYANPEDRKEVLRILSNKGVMGPREMTVVRRDGTRFTVEVLAQAIRDVSRKLIGFQASHIDVTERKRTEEALRESERQLIEAQRIGRTGSWEWSPAENKVVWSAEMYAIFGLAPETTDLTTEMCMQFFHPDDRAMVAEATRKMLEERRSQPIECRILKPDGTIGWVNGRGEAVLDASGKLLKVVGVYHDITERKRAEEMRRESEAYYRSLLNMLNGFAYCRMLFVEGRPNDFTYLEVNQAFGTLTGLKDVVGKNITTIFPTIRETDPDVLNLYGRVALTGIPERIDIYVNTLGKWLSLSVWSPRKEYFVAVFDDITERKKIEEDLRASREQLRALAARVEHVREEERASLARELHDELGQGLTALQIDLAWLDGHLRTAGPADLAVLRDKIADMVPRAERLIETTQAISAAMRPGVLDDLGLVAAMEWLAADFEKRTGLACAAKLPAADIAVDLACSVALFRIVQEALTNVVRHAKASRVEIRLRISEGEILLEVEDNGRGITPQQVAGSNSLGLLSMRERAAVFGGSVDIQSAAGTGTTVRAIMPMNGLGNP